jgi:carbon storage regulator
MLVLKRKKDETVHIGGDVTVMVVEILEHSVRLGIKAPRHVPVHRSEVVSEIISEGGVLRNYATVPSAWHQHHPNVVALVRWMMTVDPMTADEVQQVYESPGSYEGDWQAYEETL